MLIHCVTLWPWPLTPWSWTFIAFRVWCVETLYKIWAKSNNPRLSYWRFITFSTSIFRGQCTLSGRFSGMCGLNFTKLAIIDAHHSLFQSSDTLLHFQTRVAQSWLMLKTTPNFALSEPLWKLGKEWARSLCQLIKLYLRPNLRNTFDGHSLRGGWEPCIDEKKDSSAAFIKTGRLVKKTDLKKMQKRGLFSYTEMYIAYTKEIPNYTGGNCD